MKIFSLFLILLSSFVFSQTLEEEKIKASVNQLFDGMKTSDSVLVKNSFSKDAAFHLFDINGNFVTDSPKQFVKTVGRTPKGNLDERATSWKISIDGNIANAWVSYVFYYKNEFSHCGVDNFVLIKENNIWKIHYLIFTVRKDKCEN